MPYIKFIPSVSHTLHLYTREESSFSWLASLDFVEPSLSTLRESRSLAKIYVDEWGFEMTDSGLLQSLLFIFSV